jgi:hypothetical protein
VVAEPDFDEPEPVVEVEIIEAEIVEADQAEVVEAEPAEVVDLRADGITDAQLKALHAALTGMGIKDRDRGLTMLGRMIGRDITSTKDLTKSEASKLIDALKDEGDDE